MEIVLKTTWKVFLDINFDFWSPDAAKLTEEGAAIIFSGILVAYNMLQCLPSCITLEKALDGGLLQILAFSSTPCVLAKLDRNTEGTIRSILESSLVGCMMVRQVFLSVRKAVTKIRALAPYLVHSDNSPLQAAPTRLHDSWNLLFSNVKHHSASLKAFSYERKLEEVACENVRWTSDQLLLPY